MESIGVLRNKLLDQEKGVHKEKSGISIEKLWYTLLLKINFFKFYHIYVEYILLYHICGIYLTNSYISFY